MSETSRAQFLETESSNKQLREAIINYVLSSDVGKSKTRDIAAAIDAEYGVSEHPDSINAELRGLESYLELEEYALNKSTEYPLIWNLEELSSNHSSELESLLEASETQSSEKTDFRGLIAEYLIEIQPKHFKANNLIEYFSEEHDLDLNAKQMGRHLGLLRQELDIPAEDWKWGYSKSTTYNGEKILEDYRDVVEKRASELNHQ